MTNKSSNPIEQHTPFKRTAPSLTALALSLITTFTIFSSVVSIAKEPPSAMAAKRSTDAAPTVVAAASTPKAAVVR